MRAPRGDRVRSKCEGRMSGTDAVLPGTSAELGAAPMSLPLGAPACTVIECAAIPAQLELLASLILQRLAAH
jgi:hypothetical protein